MKKTKTGESGASMRERVSRALDLPPDLFPGGSLVEIRGQNALCLRGGGAILRYTREEICVALQRGTLEVKGKRLVCTAYRRGSLGIDGFIESVRFCPPSEEPKGGRRV